MQIHLAIELLTNMQDKDKKFFEDKLKETGGSFCADCKKNTFVGLYPFWHRFARTLCSNCGKEYVNLLKEIKAWDI